MRNLLQDLWPVLAVLVVILWTAIGTVLAAVCRHHLDIHDRVRASKQMRRDYLRSVRDRLAGNVDVEER